MGLSKAIEGYRRLKQRSFLKHEINIHSLKCVGLFTINAEIMAYTEYYDLGPTCKALFEVYQSAEI